MTQPRCHPFLGFCLAVASLIGVFSFVSSASAEDFAKVAFDLPADSGDHSLLKFSAQSGQEVLFVSETAARVRTNAVNGSFTPRAAIDLLLQGTGLTAVEDPASHSFRVVAAAAAGAGAMTSPVGSGRPGSGQEQAITLNPFEVTVGADKGYTALNSNSITAFNVALDHVPVTADIIDSAFLKDVGSPLTLEGALQNYDAGATFSAGNVTNAYQNQPGDRVASPTLRVRGSNVNGVQVNGIQLNAGNYGNTNFGSTSLFGIDRIEVIDGAQSLLFGGGGSGAVVNTVTNEAYFGRPTFGSLQYQMDQYGTKNVTFDSGAGTDNLAVRFTAVQNSTDTRRVGVGDQLVGQYLQFAAKLLNTTFKVTLQQTVDNAVTPQYQTLSSSGDPQFSQFNGDHLEYLLATNQAGGILNGHLNWNNVESLLGRLNSDSDVSETGMFEADSRWTNWFSTQLTVAAANFNADQGGASSAINFYSPGATANPLPGNWTMSEPQSGFPLEDSWRSHTNKAIRFTGLLTNELFGGTAKSQTSFDADYTGDKLTITGYSYYQADSNFNILLNSTSTTNAFRTVIPSQQWTVNNGPVYYALTNPLFGAVGAANDHLTLGGVNYVRAITTPNAVGDGTSASDGYAVVNYTQWLGGKLDTMAGARITTAWGSGNVLIHDAVSYSLGVDYHVTNWLVPYADYSSIWTTQSAGTFEPDGAIEPPAHDVGEELGVKFDPANTKISGSLSAYTSSNHNQSTSVPNISSDVSPNGLNGQVPQGTGNDQPANVLTYGLAAQLTANPTDNWRMRLSAQWNGGRYKDGISYPQNYNDQFYENAAGDVTYADGSIVYVPATFNKSQLTVPAGTAGAIPLTTTLLSTPGSQYYANPAVVTGAINKTSNGGLVLLSGTNATHGPILTGATGLPISDYQLLPSLSGVTPFGTVVATTAGSQTASYPSYALNFTSVYTLPHGWFQGFKFGGTVNAQWRNLQVNYNPASTELPAADQQEFYLPTNVTFNLITGYTRKFKRVTWNSQVNVFNLFNHYYVVLYPTTTTGFSSTNSVGANLLNSHRYYQWTNTISF